MTQENIKRRERYLKMMPQEIVALEKARVKSLRGKLKKKGLIYKDVCLALKCTERTLSYKLDFETDFSTIEMNTLLKMLE